MTKAELTNAIAQETGISCKNVSLALESFFSNVKTALQNNDEVIIRNFGTFHMKHKAAKIARNIQQGTSIVVPEKDVPHFTPSKNF